MDLKKLIKIKDLILLPIIFVWLLYTIGYNSSMQIICKHENATVYLYQKHDFQTVIWGGMETKHHCLKEIPKTTCFAGQKQIQNKLCYVIEDLGGNYGYITHETKI